MPPITLNGNEIVQPLWLSLSKSLRSTTQCAAPCHWGKSHQSQSARILLKEKQQVESSRKLGFFYFAESQRRESEIKFGTDWTKHLRDISHQKCRFWQSQTLLRLYHEDLGHQTHRLHSDWGLKHHIRNSPLYDNLDNFGLKSVVGSYDRTKIPCWQK